MRRSRVAELLEVLGPPAHLEVLSERHELLRFATSRITYQHSEERLLVRARLLRNGASVWGTASSVRPTTLRGLRERLVEMLGGLPAGGEASLAEPGGGSTKARTYFESTARARAEDRTGLFSQALAACPPGATLGGSISHTLVEHTVANTSGLMRSERRTRVGAQFIGAIDGQDRSSVGRALHRDATALPIDAALEELRGGLRSLPNRTLEPGNYRTVLGPQATIALVALFGQIALGARQYLDGLSAVSGAMGERVVSPLVTLIDNGCDAHGLPTSFDSEGFSKELVPLINEGVLDGVVHDAQTARRAGTQPTGHAAPPGWRFGADPIPSHLLMAAGDASDQDLLAACDTGLSIQRVDYVRVVNARQTLVTGTTRDATRWIEHGRIAARVPQFRFTLRLADLLGCVEAIGRNRERGDSVFMESVVAPAILVAALPVQVVVAD
jgi:predicted Zn-dependent protease